MQKPSMDWAQVSKEELVLLLNVIGNDGHTIYSANYLSEHHVSQAVIEEFATEHYSDGTLKGSIESNGAVVESMCGVYGLYVLESLARHLGVTSTAMGRGFRARELTAGMRDALSSSS